MIEGKTGQLGMTRRGDLTIGLDSTLRNGADEAVLDTSLTPIVMPPFKAIFVSENGQIYVDATHIYIGSKNSKIRLNLEDPTGELEAYKRLRKTIKIGTEKVFKKVCQ